MINFPLLLILSQAEYIKQILNDLSDLSEFTPTPKTFYCSVQNYDMIILDK